MVQVDRIANVVQRNCDISDARHARNYTLCVYLLKMREYYRWERGCGRTTALDSGDLSDWVTARERLWEELEPAEFACVPVVDTCLEPFAARDINADLVPRGYVYSAGLGRFVKPHFFLGRLVRREERGPFTVLVSDQELARDLAAPPAMYLDQVIYVRRDALRRLVWERVEEWQWRKSPAGPMARALEHRGFPRDPDQALEGIVADEEEALILHEVGEGRVARDLGPAWEDLLYAHAGGRAEMPLRAVRDLYADCHTALPELLAAGRDASVHFYMANLKGLRKALFPALEQAYRNWVEGGPRSALTATIAAGADHWPALTRELLHLYREGADEDALVAAVEAARL